MQHKSVKWAYLILLSLIWGSSFILIKKSLIGLTPIQLGALRSLLAALFLVLVGYRTLKHISISDWKWVTLSGLCGTFIPAFLFAFAETEIDSGIASVLNSTTPMITLILGVLVFSVRFHQNQLLGIVIGFVGCLVLVLEGASMHPNQNYWYALLVLLASVCYAINVNVIKRHLQHLSSLTITTGNFVILIIPSIIILCFSDFFNQQMLSDSQTHKALLYISILALLCTAVAKVIFNKLIQISTPVFATSVTYTIPVIALLWGLLDKEHFTMYQIVASAVIILGVYIVNKT